MFVLFVSPIVGNKVLAERPLQCGEVAALACCDRTPLSSSHYGHVLPIAHHHGWPKAFVVLDFRRGRKESRRGMGQHLIGFTIAQTLTNRKGN